jgi:predicted anti-sigma-YlaC factor YlaD
MNCEEATKLMDGYLDGELDPITSQTIVQELRGCRNCEQAYRLSSRSSQDKRRTVESASEILTDA